MGLGMLILIGAFEKREPNIDSHIQFSFSMRTREVPLFFFQNSQMRLPELHGCSRTVGGQRAMQIELWVTLMKLGHKALRPDPSYNYQ